MKEVIVNAVSYALSNDGATFNLLGMIKENKGYMVSFAGYEKVSEQLVLDDVVAFVENNLGIIQSVSNIYVGIWKSEGLWYIDLSAHILDRTQAVKIGVIGEQKAIWDIENGAEIFLK